MSAFLRISQRKLNNYNQPGIDGPSGGGGNGFIRALNQQGTAAYTWAVSPTSDPGRPHRRQPHQRRKRLRPTSAAPACSIAIRHHRPAHFGNHRRTHSANALRLHPARPPGHQPPIPESAQLQLQGELHQEPGPPRAEGGLRVRRHPHAGARRQSSLRPGFLRRRLQPSRGRAGGRHQLLPRRFHVRPAQRLSACHLSRRPLPAARELRLLAGRFPRQPQADLERRRTLRIRHSALGTRQPAFQLRSRFQ